MKRTLILILTLMMLLSACESAPEQETSAPEASGETTSDTTKATTPPTTEAPEAVFEEIVLADDENVTVKITAVEEDSLWGYTLKVYLENNTDKELMYTLDEVSVNGFMVDPYWATTVASGKKANSTIHFMDTALEENGITEIEEITFTLRICDNGDWLADDIFNDSFTINL